MSTFSGATGAESWLWNPQGHPQQRRNMFLVTRSHSPEDGGWRKPAQPFPSRGENGPQWRGPRRRGHPQGLSREVRLDGVAGVRREKWEPHRSPRS